LPVRKGLERPSVDTPQGHNNERGGRRQQEERREIASGRTQTVDNIALATIENQAKDEACAAEQGRTSGLDRGVLGSAAVGKLGRCAQGWWCASWAPEVWYWSASGAIEANSSAFPAAAPPLMRDMGASTRFRNQTPEGLARLLGRTRLAPIGVIEDNGVLSHPLVGSARLGVRGRPQAEVDESRPRPTPYKSASEREAGRHRVRRNRVSVPWPATAPLPVPGCPITLWFRP